MWLNKFLFLIQAFPDLKGIAVMKDTGEYLLGKRGEWLPDKEAMFV